MWVFVYGDVTHIINCTNIFFLHTAIGGPEHEVGSKPLKRGGKPSKLLNPDQHHKITQHKARVLLGQRDFCCHGACECLPRKSGANAARKNKYRKCSRNAESRILQVGYKPRNPSHVCPEILDQLELLGQTQN